MPSILSRFTGPANIPSGTSTLFTGTSGHVYTIKHISIVNPTGGAIAVSLGVNGSSNANLILPSTSIDAGGRAEFSGLEVLTGTETLISIASATGCTISVSGLDQS